MKKYLITSPEFYTDTPTIFAQKLNEQIKKHKPDFIEINRQIIMQI